jgi:chromosomal replication initiation ATPase DnaA
MGKLQLLASAAAEFYGVPIASLTSPCRMAIYTKPRHTCQWIADNAGYKKSDIARFWKVDRASVYYGVKIVSERIKANKNEADELKRFLRHVKVHMKNESNIHHR